MAASPRARRPAFSVAWAVCTALAVAAALVAIWWPPYTPGQDTPHHLFFAEIVAEPSRFAADYRVIFAPNAQGFVYLAALLQPLGLVVAGKVVRTLGLGLLLLAYWVLGRSLGERRPPGLLFGVAASASFFHAMGFENFALALPLGVLAVGLAIRAAREGGRRRWLFVGVTLVLTSLGHAVVAGMVGLELLLVVLLAAPSGLRLRRLGALVAVSVPAAAHALACVWLSAVSQAERGITAGLGTQRLPAVEQLESLVACSFGGYSALGGLVVGAALALALAEWARKGSDLSDGQRLGRRLALTTVVVWGTAYFATPFHVAGWAYAQPRVLVLAVLVPTGLLGWSRWRAPLLAVATVAVLAFLGTSASGEHTAGEAVAAQVARFGDGPVGHAMAVTLDPGSPPTSRYVGPLSGAELYVVARWGGAVPHVHAANPAIHAVLARRPPSAWPPHPPLFIYRSLDCTFNPDCAEAGVALAERIAVQGLRFDTVLLVGGPETFREALVARGYERLAPDRFAPRPGALEVVLEPVPALAEIGLVVRAGYPEAMGWFTGAQRAPAPAAEPPTLTLSPLPAGPLTLECRWLRRPDELTALDDAPVGCRVDVTVAAGEQRVVRVDLREPE